MASLLLPSTTTAISSHSQLSSRPVILAKPPRMLNSTRLTAVSCNAKDESAQGKVDRRNLLLGVGGLYGAANLVSGDAPGALATPISAPDLSKCSRGMNLNTDKPLDENCCPPASTGKIVDYRLPPVGKLRVRPTAHLASREYIAKYERAINLMKALPPSDPRSFTQQANVHCAYCNLTYNQTGDSNKKLQIHNSWLFFPWHRWYLYFYERILGKLVNDPGFVLPYWNWDHPAGMSIPEMFTRDTKSPLYNARRNQHHLPPVRADLTYHNNRSDPSIVVPNNLREMYNEMTRAVYLEDFYGAKYVVGCDPEPGAGTVERGSHTAVHAWVGDPCSPSGEDLGNFYSAGRDPLFYSHHANVDRLWTIWCQLRPKNKPCFFDDSEWLDANFLFYDENARLVRVRVRDCVNELNMGFVSQKADLPWLKNRPPKRMRRRKPNAPAAAKPPKVFFPVKLNKVVRVLVDRPDNKNKEPELLVIDGIEVDSSNFARFDVFVNDEDDVPGEVIDKAEYAGCYSQLPHKNSTRVRSKIRLGLTELLEDLDVEGDKQILVSLVPRARGEDISIGGVKISISSKLSSCG